MSKDFAFEPIPGLPNLPPPGESVIWQGAPNWKALAVQGFHVRKVAVYFAIVILYQLVVHIGAGSGASEAARMAMLPALFGLVSLAILSGLAFAYARTTVYTVTSRRVVLRHGLALPMSINIPFAVIDGVALQRHGGTTGTLAMQLGAGHRISWLTLWPNLRPWHLTQPQPAFRAVDDPQSAADLLTRAIKDSEGSAILISATGAEAEAGARAGGLPAAVEGMKAA